MKYTVNELMQAIDRSRPVTEKWIERKGFNPTTKQVNGRDLKAYELTSEQLADLRHAVTGENIIEAEYEPHYEPTINHTETQSQQGNFFDKLLEYNEKNLQRIESYIERATYAEAQQKLITTSEANKDKEIYRLQAELKQAESTLEAEKEKNIPKKYPKRDKIIIGSVAGSMLFILVILSVWILQNYNAAQYWNKLSKQTQQKHIEDLNKINRL